MLTLKENDEILACWPASIMKRDYSVLTKEVENAIAKHPSANRIDFYYTQKHYMGVDFKPGASDARHLMAVISNEYDEFEPTAIYCKVSDTYVRA